MNKATIIKHEIEKLMDEQPGNAVGSILNSILDLVTSGDARAEKSMLTMKEACEYTGYSTNTLYSLVKRKQISYSKPEGKGKLFFTREDLDAYMRSGYVPSESRVDTMASSFLLNHKMS